MTWPRRTRGSAPRRPGAYENDAGSCLTGERPGGAARPALQFFTGRQGLQDAVELLEQQFVVVAGFAGAGLDPHDHLERRSEPHAAPVDLGERDDAGRVERRVGMKFHFELVALE